jgi:hypothetical protein
MFKTLVCFVFRRLASTLQKLPEKIQGNEKEKWNTSRLLSPLLPFPRRDGIGIRPQASLAYACL